MKKEPTPKQLAARKAASDRLKQMHADKKLNAPNSAELPEAPVDKQDSPDLSAMQRQINEVMETNALLKAALLGKSQNTQVGVGRSGQLLGEVDKYLVDPENYPDPTRRLADEARLQTIAFNHNYELQYEFSIRSYETKTGVNMREPDFLITLLRVVLDDQGRRVQIPNKAGELQDKFIIARRFVFKEDPQAALVLARENNISIDREDEKTFLDEMRYLRVRDWLFDYFWPKPADQKEAIREEAVGGTIVQVYTKSSVEPSSVDFDKLKNKLGV